MAQVTIAPNIRGATLPKSTEADMQRRCSRIREIAEDRAVSVRGKLSLLGDGIASFVAPAPRGASLEAPLVAVAQTYTRLLEQLSERNALPARFRCFLEKHIVSGFNSDKYRLSATSLSSMLIAGAKDPLGLGKSLNPAISARLAEKMHELPPSQICRCLSESELVGVAPRIAIRMALHACSNTPAASTQELLRVAEILALKGICSPEILESLSRAFESRIQSESPLCGAKMVSAIRNLCGVPNSDSQAPRQPGSQDFFTGWAAKLSEPAAGITAQVAILIAEGLRNGIQPKDACRPALSALASSAEADYGPRSVPSLVELAKVLATFEVHDASIPAMIASRLGDRLHVLDDASLASLVSSFGRLGWRDDTFLAKARDAAVARLSGSSIGGKLVADLLVGFQRLGIKDQALAEAAGSYITARKQGFSPDDLYRALFAVAYMEPSCLAGKLTASEVDATPNPQARRKGHNALLLIEGLRAVQAAPKEYCLDSGTERQVGTTQARILESSTARLLGEALRRHGAKDFKVIQNAELCGAEVDFVVVTRNKRYIIELDGAEHHDLYGPSALPGQRSGHDEAQDAMFKALKYGVFHLSAKEARAGTGEAISAIAAAIAADGERLKASRPPDYPERFVRSAPAA